MEDAVWEGSIPLEIRLSPSECRTFDQTDPYLIQCPRLSYLPFLLKRVHAFFTPCLIEEDVSAHSGWFGFEDIPLKWHYPVGLLYDLFSGATPSARSLTAEASSDDSISLLPWKLMLHFKDWPEDHLIRLDESGRVHHDAYINSVKEADFLRNGTAKGIMSLSKEDSTQLWLAVQQYDPQLFKPISHKLLYAQGAPLRHIPIKFYLPSSPTDSEPTSGHLRVVQSLVTPVISGTREPQTLGTALYTLLPTLFLSRRTPILARPVLHGAVVPMGALLEELVKEAAYLDGWIHLGIEMIG